MSTPDSPIAVAFNDPVLRAEGMKDDTYGEARRFFDLTDWQLHEIVCHCHFGDTMVAKTAARRVRNAIGNPGHAQSREEENAEQLDLNS